MLYVLAAPSAGEGSRVRKEGYCTVQCGVDGLVRCVTNVVCKMKFVGKIPMFSSLFANDAKKPFSALVGLCFVDPQ